LLIAVTLLFTITGALALGIVVGYGLISGILQIMGHRPESKPAPELATQAHGGD
jgi:hypothetical protein